MSALHDLFKDMQEIESNEVVDIDVAELIEYAIEAKQHEVAETLRFMDRIDNAFNELKGNDYVSTSDVEAFESKINGLLDHIGASNLSSILLPSFEASSISSYTAEAEEKKEEVKKGLGAKIKAALSWIWQKLVTFWNWVTRKNKEKEEKAEEEVKTKVDDLKEDAVAAIKKLAGSKDSLDTSMKRGEKSSASLNEKMKDIDSGVIKITVPGILVKSGRINIKEAFEIDKVEKMMDSYVKACNAQLSSITKENIFDQEWITESNRWAADPDVISAINTAVVIGARDDDGKQTTVDFFPAQLDSIRTDALYAIEKIHKMRNSLLSASNKLIKKYQSVLNSLTDKDWEKASNIGSNKTEMMELPKSLQKFLNEADKACTRVIDTVAKSVKAMEISAGK